MDRVEGAQGGLGKRPRAFQQGPIERKQRERVDQLGGALEQQVEGKGRLQP